ncbi:MAG: vitamin K epoxide reductase family protein [Gemmatimonadales bacterium]
MNDTPAATPGLTPRHWIALTALISAIVATYLHLWKIGLAGTLVCGAGHGCEVAQFSSYGYFLKQDVALIGAVGYVLIFSTALIGTFPARINDRRITVALAALIIPAFLFTLRLKYGEFIVLKTFCPWCAVSATTITLHVLLVIADWKRARRIVHFRAA